VTGHPADHPGPFVLVDDLEAPVLDPGDARHLQRVLRLSSGAALVLGDGRGRWRPARLGDPVQPAGPIEAAPRDEPTLAVGFALVKGERPEQVVQKLTELGIDRIVPFRAERSVVRWDEARSVKAVARLRTIARAATMQCHRPWLPQVDDVADLEALLRTQGVAVADRGGDAPRLHPLVLVGPEGGWSPEERASADDAGAARMALAPHVLRAETASVAVGSLLAALRAGLLDSHAQ
jgi:16S rRNA (uracil1498-N3)-methyltransferase